MLLLSALILLHYKIITDSKIIKVLTIRVFCNCISQQTVAHIILYGHASLLVSGVHLTPASSTWFIQFVLTVPIGLAGQSSSELSLPVHRTSSSHTFPTPRPKVALSKPTEPICSCMYW